MHPLVLRLPANLLFPLMLDGRHLRVAFYCWSHGAIAKSKILHRLHTKMCMLETFGSGIDFALTTVGTRDIFCLLPK